MTAKRANVLISSAGRRVSLLEAFRHSIRALGCEGRLLAADHSRLSAAFHLADRAFLVPACADPSFVPEMLEICRREDVRLIVPTIDTELPVYAKQRNAFEAVGTVVAISASETVEIGSDKARTHAWLTAQGLPTVRQHTLQEARQGMAPEMPLVIKPRFGSASIGVRLIRRIDELATAVEAHDVVVQELAPGNEHTVDIFVDRSGCCRCAVPRRRLEVRGGEVSKGITVRSARLIALARQLGEALPGAFGVLNVQVFVDAVSDRLSIIEINPRFGGGFPLSYAAGADYPRWLLEEVMGFPCTARDDLWRDGVVMLRYDGAVFVDATTAGFGAG